MAIIKPFKIKSFKKKNPSIEFKNVSLGFGNRLILNNINFTQNNLFFHVSGTISLTISIGK